MRLFFLIKKEFIEIFRQRDQLPLLFIVPLFQVIVLGYVVTTDIRRLPVDIVNMSDTPAAGRIVHRIQASPLFDVRHVRSNFDETMEPLRKGSVKAVILFRDRLEDAGAVSAYPEIQILMDGVDSNTSSVAAGYFNGVIRQFILGDFEKMGHEVPIENRTLIRFNPGLRSINYMGPGIVALLLTILTQFFTSISIVREKVQQTMDTLLMSRLTPIDIYLGKAMPMAIIGLVNMIVGTGVVIAWFGIPLRGNFLYLILAGIIFLAAILSFALLISTLVETHQQALFFSWFSSVIFMLLSGLFTPVENVPLGVRWIADINPVRYLVSIIREIFLKGNSIRYFYMDLLILSCIAAVVITLSLLNYRRFVTR
jgi:ABC-2 type transport system permease protein